MPQVPSEPIQTPADDDIKPSTSSVRQHLIEGWSPILRAAHATIDILRGGPGARLHIAPQFLNLVLGLLIERRDARVNRGPHECAPASIAPALRIWSATLSTRCADRSGIALPAPHQD